MFVKYISVALFLMVLYQICINETNAVECDNKPGLALDVFKCGGATYEFLRFLTCTPPENQTYYDSNGVGKVRLICAATSNCTDYGNTECVATHDFKYNPRCYCYKKTVDP